jgi:hypothetical protein
MDSVTRLDATEKDGDRLEMYSHRFWWARETRRDGSGTHEKKKNKVGR